MNKSVENKWKKIRIYTKTQNLFLRKYQVLIEEVFVIHNHNHNIAFLFYMMQDNNTTAQEPTDSEEFRTDADIVKELVEMKFLAKKTNIRFRTPTQRLFSRNSEFLIDNDATNYVTENV